MATAYSRTLRYSPDRVDIQSGFTHGDRVKPLGYSRFVVNSTGRRAQFWRPRDSLLAADASAIARFQNKLLGKFQNELGDSSSFGATLTAERKETFLMLTSTVLRLAKAARHINRFDFASAAKILGLPYKERTVKRKVRVGRHVSHGRSRPGRIIIKRSRVFKLPSGREVLKTSANGWLLWSYGVKPLAQDIKNGLDILERPLLLEEKVRVGSRSGPYRSIEKWGGPGTGYYLTITENSGAVSGSCGALVSVSNPNAYLSNKMGLANPFQWVVEGIPGSFIVDWFSNLSQVIGQYNWDYGYDISSRWMSIRIDGTYDFFTASPWGGSYKNSGVEFERKLTLPSVTLLFEYERFEWQRSLNAISLLLGFLPWKSSH